ncbi:MAG: carbohydrate kinase family protein [Pseudomonadota bacterium]
MKKIPALTFGSAMVDTIAVLASDSIEHLSLSNAHQQFLLVEPGRKVEAQAITTDIGGGALNTAVSLSLLGCAAAPVVKTGNDASRAHVLEHCNNFQLDVSCILEDAADSTGSAVMIASHDKNAAIFTNRGSNTRLINSDIEALSFTDLDLIHAAPLSGDSALMLPTIAKLAEDHGAFFSTNPGIRQITTRTNSVFTAAKSMSLISINSLEAIALIPSLSALSGDLDWGCPDKDEPCLDSQGGKIGLRKFCEALSDHGPKNVLVTYGSDGAYLYSDGELHHQPIISAKVAGTAGAGDSFVSTLAWALQSKYSPQDAMCLAAYNASSVVSFVNTTDGLLSNDALIARAGL